MTDMTIELPPATIPATFHYAWASQVRQYPKVGRPGLHHEAHEVTVATPGDNPTALHAAAAKSTIDCLLFRNRKGHLVGILNHYRNDCYEFDGTLLERAGNVNLWVRPDRQRRGIGRRLLAEADRRWPIDWTAQRYTEAGRALVLAYLEGGTT